MAVKEHFLHLADISKVLVIEQADNNRCPLHDRGRHLLNIHL